MATRCYVSNYLSSLLIFKRIMTLKEEKELEHYLNTNKKSGFYKHVEQSLPVNWNPCAEPDVVRGKKSMFSK